MYAWCVARLDPEKDRVMWDEQLVTPLNPNAKPTPQQIEDEGEGFMNLLGMVQSGEVKHASAR